MMTNKERFSDDFVGSGLQKHVDAYERGRALRTREEANVARLRRRVTKSCDTWTRPLQVPRSVV